MGITSRINKSGNVGLEERIRLVENGLLPAVIEIGCENQRASLVDRMRFYRVPGVSIAVINDGEIEWAQGYGTTEASCGTPVTPETLFQAASISKPITAAGALRLVQEGRLTLDSDVNAWLTSWRVPENEYTIESKVTLRTLLSHCGGLGVKGFLGYTAGSPLPTITQVLDGTAPANNPAVRVEAVPGSQWSYSGGGYAVLQLLMADLTGTQFPQLMQEMVLRPLGMERSTFTQPLASERVDEASAGHIAGEMIAGRYHIHPEMAAAGLWTTPSDLARFAVAIQRALKKEHEPVVDHSSVEKMLTVQKENYGLGFTITGDGTEKRFSHSGSNIGFLCLLEAYELIGRGAVIMTNASMSSPLISEIIGSIASVYQWPEYPVNTQREFVKLDEALLNEYAGRYISPVDSSEVGISVSKEEGRIFLETERPGKIEFFADADGSFFTLGSDMQVSFTSTSELQIEVRQGSNVWYGHQIHD